MITKRIPKSTEHADNFERLANYIASADHPGEKMRDFWMGNCNAGDAIEDLELGVVEIEATRRQQPEIKDKTYHFIVSFQPGEEDKLTKDDLQEMAQRFVDELGFEGHQYVAGTHQNTNNFHMHVAVNRVHPETLKVHNPYRDFKTRDRVARELEQKYGLEIDWGKDAGKERDGLSAEARDFERHTWQQSFQSYVIENKENILDAINAAENWKELLQALGSGWGIELKKRGAGLVFANLDEPHQTMKASGLDRSCSVKAMENRLGAFEGRDGTRVQDKEQQRSGQRYEPRPLLRRHSGMDKLWKRFLGTPGRSTDKTTLLGRVASNWKLWLMTEAYSDPLGMVVLVAYQEALRTLLEPEDGRKHLPKEIEPQMARWRSLASWTKPRAGKPHTGHEEAPFQDAEGNQVAPIRDKDAQLVGLMLFDKNGRMSAIGDIPQERQLGNEKGIDR